MKNARHILLALSVVLTVHLPACNQVADAPPSWFREPSPQSAESIPPQPDVAVSSQPQSLSDPTGFFGWSGFGSNYSCPPPGTRCACGPSPDSPDCEKLKKSGKCNGAPIGNCNPECVDLPNGRRKCTQPICDCGLRPPKDQYWAMVDGFYKTASSPSIYKRNDNGSRACAVMGSQWQKLTAQGRNPGAFILSDADMSAFLGMIYSNQYCSGLEVGVTAGLEGQLQFGPRGYHHFPDGTVRRLWDYRSCNLTWHQFHDLLHDPAVTEVTGTQVSLYLEAFDSGAVCFDAEI